MALGKDRIGEKRDWKEGQHTALSKHEWDGDGAAPAGTVVHEERLRGVRVRGDAELRGWRCGAGGTRGLCVWGEMGHGWVLCWRVLCWDGCCGW